MEGQVSELRIWYKHCGGRTKKRGYPKYGYPDLPDWLLWEILSRLPARSIFRFKCVCKCWLAMISDPHFASSYSRQLGDSTYNPPLCTLLASYNDAFEAIPDQVAAKLSDTEIFKSSTFNLQFLEKAIKKEGQKYSMEVLGVSNGLLLCSADKFEPRIYCVCNPLTKEWVCLPRSRCHYIRVSVGFFAEPIDGSYWVVHTEGFLDPSKDLYLEVFSSKVGFWLLRKYGAFHNAPARSGRLALKECAVFFKESLHWVRNDFKIFANDPRTRTDSCFLMDLPEACLDKKMGLLGVSQDNLHYVKEQGVPSRDGSLTVWIMKDYENRIWCALYKISLSSICTAHPTVNLALNKNSLHIVALAFHPQNSDVLYLTCVRRLASFNLHTRRLEILRPAMVSSWRAFSFVPPRWPAPVRKPEININAI